MITKKQLKTSVKKIKELIDLANNENILNVTVGFFQQVKFLGDNRGKSTLICQEKGVFYASLFQTKQKKKFSLLFAYLERLKKFKI